MVLKVVTKTEVLSFPVTSIMEAWERTKKMSNTIEIVVLFDSSTKERLFEGTAGEWMRFAICYR